MRINPNGKDGSTHVYTINMFHTVNKIHINGKSHACFIKDDLPRIIDLLKKKLPDADKLNSILRQALQSVQLATQQNDTDTSKKNPSELLKFRNDNEVNEVNAFDGRDGEISDKSHNLENEKDTSDLVVNDSPSISQNLSVLPRT